MQNQISDDSDSTTKASVEVPGFQSDLLPVVSVQSLTTLVERFERRDNSILSEAESTSYANDLRELDDSASDVSCETRASCVASLETKPPAETPKASFLKLPTEMLQAIFLELLTLGAAESVTRTCPRLRDAFKGHEKTIIWTILSRELGPTRPGTLGALAIFVSPPKGPSDEPLLRNMAISVRYWRKMLEEYEELAKKMLTLTMATRMLDAYRQFPKKIGYRPEERSPHEWCSACTSVVLAEEDWNPRMENTDDYCIDHLLQANAVRYRLNCRMVFGSTAPDESPEGDCHIGLGWHPSRIVRNILHLVQSNGDNESELDDDFELDDSSELENEPGYDTESGYEHGFDLDNDLELGRTPGDEARLEQEDLSEMVDRIFQRDEIYPKNETHWEDEIFPEDEIYPEHKIREENELLRELYSNEFEQWIQSDEALSLDSIR